MAKNYLRKIVVNGESYLWYRAHYHLRKYELARCVEVLNVFPPNSKRNYLKIHFREEDNRLRTGMTGTWKAGYPDSGVLWLFEQGKQSTVAFNLNRPKVVAALIRLLRATQWNPAEATAPLDIENGFIWLDGYYQALLDMIDPSGIQTKPTISDIMSGTRTSP